MTSPGASRAAIVAPKRLRRLLVGEDHFVAARDGQRDRRPLPLLRFQLDRPAMRLDELAGQRQAEAERRFAADPGLLDPVEAVEYARQFLFGDARRHCRGPRSPPASRRPSAFRRIPPLRSV